MNLKATELSLTYIARLELRKKKTQKNTQKNPIKKKAKQTTNKTQEQKKPHITQTIVQKDALEAGEAAQ